MEVLPTPRGQITSALMDDDSLPDDLGRRVGDLRELPESLREQLQVGRIDELEKQVINSLSYLHGVANLDEVLVALYRMTGEVYKRTYISNKMYRMAQAGTIERKRAYTDCQTGKKIGATTFSGGPTRGGHATPRLWKRFED